MIKLYILITFFILSHINYSQNLEVYLPDGSIKSFPEGTIYGKILTYFEPLQRITSYTCECGEGENNLATIGFKFFTDEPLFIIADSKSCIKKCISEFNFSEYMRSWIMETDLERYMEDKLLTDLYVLQTLGHPNRKPKDVTGSTTFELWYYDDYNLVLKFLNGYVVGYMRLE